MAEPKTHLMHYRGGERMALCGRMAYGSWFEKPERSGGAGCHPRSSADTAGRLSAEWEAWMATCARRKR